MVLTAAHCEKDFIRFVIGTENLSDGISGEKGETRLPEKGWVHPRYNIAIMDNDLMIYKLKRPARGVDVEVITVNDNPNVPSNAGERLVALVRIVISLFSWNKHKNSLHGFIPMYNSSCLTLFF